MAQISSLHLAVEYGDLPILGILAKQMDVNEKEPRLGRTPLHLAVKKDDLEMTRILLENGARPNDVSDDKLTALHIAVGNRSVAIVILLLQNGASVEPDTKFSGKTPLYMAVDYNCPEIVEILLRAGASLNNAATPSSTLLDVADRIGSSLIKNLLQKYKRMKSMWILYQKSIIEAKSSVQRHPEHRVLRYCGGNGCNGQDEKSIRNT